MTTYLQIESEQGLLESLLYILAKMMVILGATKSWLTAPFKTHGWVLRRVMTILLSDEGPITKMMAILT